MSSLHIVLVTAFLRGRFLQHRDSLHSLLALGPRVLRAIDVYASC
jgi:hypothetical protein